MKKEDTKRTDYLSNLKLEVEKSKEYSVSFEAEKYDIEDSSIKDSNYLFIVNNETLKGSYIKILKNYTKMDLNWMYNKLEPNNNYIKIYRLVYEFLHKNGYKGIAVYPTSYGIGVDTFCSNDKFKERNKSIQELLNAHNIAYTVEYSDAGWVYRYRISKSKANIEVLKNL